MHAVDQDNEDGSHWSIGDSVANGFGGGFEIKMALELACIIFGVLATAVLNKWVRWVYSNPPVILGIKQSKT